MCQGARLAIRALIGLEKTGDKTGRLPNFLSAETGERPVCPRVSRPRVSRVSVGWNAKAWSAKGTCMSHPFGAYRINYTKHLGMLKALLLRSASSQEEPDEGAQKPLSN